MDKKNIWEKYSNTFLTIELFSKEREIKDFIQDFFK